MWPLQVVVQQHLGVELEATVGFVVNESQVELVKVWNLFLNLLQPECLHLAKLWSYIHGCIVELLL